MSNINRYIFPLTFKLENLKKCHSYTKFHARFLKVVNLNVDFIFIFSFIFWLFLMGKEGLILSNEKK